MDSSRTHNAPTLILSRWLTILHLYEQSASSAERITLMEDVISMLSLCGRRDSKHEALENSMLTIATRTSALAMELQSKVGIMQSRMEMWSGEDWKDRAETAWINLALNGAKSSLRQLQTSFGDSLEKWTLVRFAAVSPPYRNMWTGSTGPTLPTMQTRQEYNSTYCDHQDSMTGVEQILQHL